MDRKSDILERLMQADSACTGAELADALGVSRQVIVGDIAVLRAEGYNIVATPRGYLLLQPGNREPIKAVLAVHHRPDDTAEELYILVDHGLRVINVVVEHPVYGDLSGSLMLMTREDVNRFLQRVERREAPLLSSLTDGIHLHHVEFDDMTQFKKAEEVLRSKGFLHEI